MTIPNITTEGARKAACAMIEQAYRDATSPHITIQDRESAKAYLHGPMFELDAQLLGLDEHVERVRGMIDGDYQMEFMV
jgi:hypothetical protein